MAFKLKKTELKTKQEHIDALDAAYSALEGEVERFNDSLYAARLELAQARDRYNEAVSDAREWIAEVVGDWRDQFTDKSEGWQDGDKGSAAQALIDAWEGIDLSDADFDIPEAIELDIEPPAEAMGELPDAVETDD